MLDEFSTETAALRLQGAVDDLALSTSARARAQELADRLKYGVKIILLGPSGVGKSALCDAILALPLQDRPSKTTRVFGAGSCKTEPSMEMLPNISSVLGHAQVIDVSAPKDARGFAACVAEHLTSADIVVWCSQLFDEQEAQLWQLAPDSLKDHSFLVLTKADLLAEKSILRERIKSLEPVVTEEFHSFFPVTTSRLHQLQRNQEPISDGVLAASGVKALIETLSSLVTSGQRADVDSAILFLERQGLTLDDPFPTFEAHEADEVSKPLQEACKATRDRLITRAFDLAELGFDEADGDMSGVLEMCGSISEDLVEDMRRLSQDHPTLDRWSDEFETASDKIMLMTMENDTRSAADAVTILLQIRRDLEHLSLH